MSSYPQRISTSTNDESFALNAIWGVLFTKRLAFFTHKTYPQMRQGALVHKAVGNAGTSWDLFSTKNSLAKLFNFCGVLTHRLIHRLVIALSACGISRFGSYPLLGRLPITTTALKYSNTHKEKVKDCETPAAFAPSSPALVWKFHELV